MASESLLTSIMLSTPLSSDKHNIIGEKQFVNFKYQAYTHYSCLLPQKREVL